MNSVERTVLKAVKEISREKKNGLELPSRCFSFFYQPKRPVKG